MIRNKGVAFPFLLSTTNGREIHVTTSGNEGFRFLIRPADSGWTWATIDAAGEVCARGAAPTKALAAAYVIRAIARSLNPEHEAIKA